MTPARHVLADPPPGFVRSEADERVIVAEGAQDRSLLRSLGLQTLDGAFALEPLRATPVKAIARAEGRDAAGHPRVVYVKRYDFDRRVVFMKALVKANFPVFSGPTELANVLALRAAGMAAPRPLAAGEREEGARKRSFVVLEALPGRALESLPAPSSSRDRRSLVVKAARLVRALHEAGFWHKDLYLANLILDPGTGELGLCDCERVKWRAGGPRPRARARDLGSHHFSAGSFGPRDHVLFLREYLGLERLDREARRLARAALRRSRAIARRGEKG
jgi:hypothetical protein